MIKIGFSQGDINGSSLPMLVKLFQVEEMFELCTPVLYGSNPVVAELCKQHNIPTRLNTCAVVDDIKHDVFNVVECCDNKELTLTPDTVTDESKNAAKMSLEAAIHDLKTAKIDALVCLPTQGVSINVSEMTISGGIRKVTIALESQTDNDKCTETLTKTLQSISTTLKRDFLIEGPRIAVLSSLVNESEGENAASTDKPQLLNTLESVIESEFTNRNLCFGPYNAKKFFKENMQGNYDAILFTDKESANSAESNEDAFYYSMGLPVVIVGTKCSNLFFEIDEGTQAMRNAIFTALDTTRNRHFYDKARTNVLRRLYYEKRDDSDKLKLD